MGNTTTMYPESRGAAVVIIVLTAVSVCSSALTHVLFRMSGQRVSFVSLLGLVLACMQIFSLVQASLVYSRWSTFVSLEYDFLINQVWGYKHASMACQAPIMLEPRIFFAFRKYFFNVFSLLFLSWSIVLYLSTSEVRNGFIRQPNFARILKVLCFALPAVQTILVNLPIVIQNEQLQISLVNSITFFSLALNTLFLSLILVKSLRTRAKTREVNRSMYDHDILPRSNIFRKNSTSTQSSRSGPEHDRWAIVRFLLGYCVLTALQLSYFLMQFNNARTIHSYRLKLGSPPTPGWTKTQQIEYWLTYLPSAVVGLVIFAIYGTSEECREHLHDIFHSLCHCSSHRRPKPSPDWPPSPPLASRLQPEWKETFFRTDYRITTLTVDTIQTPSANQTNFPRTPRSPVFCRDRRVDYEPAGYFPDSPREATFENTFTTFAGKGGEVVIAPVVPGFMRYSVGERGLRRSDIADAV